MSYTPTTWNTGDTITASALNKIENGIANAGGNLYLTCTRDGDTVSTGITIGDAIDAMKTGKSIIMYIPDDGGVAADTVTTLLSIRKNGSYYQPYCIVGTGVYEMMGGTRSSDLAFYLD